jgi:hypothetical protein
MRDLSVVRSRLTFNGKVWVPRIVHDEEVSAGTPLETWRETDTVLFSSKPTDELLKAASEVGVCIGVMHADGRAIEIRDLRRISRFPAVVFVKIDDERPLDSSWRSAAPNLLLARWQQDESVPLQDDETDFFFVRVDPNGSPFNTELKVWPVSFPRPLIPVIPLARTMPLERARAGCDDLQRRLAGKYDAAGYLV